MGRVVLIVLDIGGTFNQSENLQEAIRRELESNPFWRKWKIDKITILDDTTEQTIV